MNWKLGVDTFLEYYHVPILHRASIGKTLFGTVFLYEACGRHALAGGAPPQHHGPARRRPGDVACGCRTRPSSYRLFPNAVFISQGPHVELARFFPDPERPDTTLCRFSFASPSEDRSNRDWEEMMRLALGVLDNEDFAVMEGVQANLAAGIQREIVFGPERDRAAQFPSGSVTPRLPAERALGARTWARPISSPSAPRPRRQ